MVATPYVQGVLRFVIPLLFVCWAGAHADDSLPKWLQEPGQIIEGPITPEMCIVIYWPHRSPSGYRYTFPTLPMEPESINAVLRMRQSGEIVVYSCRSSDA